MYGDLTKTVGEINSVMIAYTDFSFRASSGNLRKTFEGIITSGYYNLASGALHFPHFFHQHF